MTLGNLKEK